MPRLSVNLNKVAFLRNSRRTGVPDLLKFAELAFWAGADGITIHPRPDERHIRTEDVFALAQWMLPLRPAFELNIEGYPDDRLFELVRAVRPERCTLVPDPPTAFTSDEGWKFDGRDAPIVREAVARFRHACGRVTMFVGPDPAVVPALVDSGADGAEIYTGSYAARFRQGGAGPLLAVITQMAQALDLAGFAVNIGHDLNLCNLPDLVAGLPQMREASVGHELIADALVLGLGPAIRAYKDVLS